MGRGCKGGDPDAIGTILGPSYVGLMRAGSCRGTGESELWAGNVEGQLLLVAVHDLLTVISLHFQVHQRSEKDSSTHD